MVLIILRDVWRSVSTTSGGQSVAEHGTFLLPELSAGNLVSQQIRVKYTRVQECGSRIHSLNLSKVPIL